MYQSPHIELKKITPDFPLWIESTTKAALIQGDRMTWEKGYNLTTLYPNVDLRETDV